MFKKITSFFVDSIQVLVFALSIFAFVYLLILQPHKINGHSMMPNFPDKEFLLTDKVTYRFNDPKRGDVIVFKPPTETHGEEYIKRIIGLPGEKVMLQNGHFYINGRILREDYIANDIYTSGGFFLPEGKEIVVPDGEYFVAGDNRPHSSDSREWGFMDRGSITGKAWLVYWPISNAGTVPSPEYSL